MTEFIQTKLGEVLAFARSGEETLEKGREGFEKALDKETITKAKQTCADLAKEIEALAAKEQATLAVEKSAKETLEKVTDMRDEYVDGKWDEASEVLEWMGFYTGAALVHWYLLSGAGKDDAELGALAGNAIGFYTTLFSADKTVLAGIGMKQNEA